MQVPPAGDDVWQQRAGHETRDHSETAAGLLHSGANQDHEIGGEDADGGTKGQLYLTRPELDLERPEREIQRL